MSSKKKSKQGSVPAKKADEPNDIPQEPNAPQVSSHPDTEEMKKNPDLYLRKMNENTMQQLRNQELVEQRMKQVNQLLAQQQQFFPESSCSSQQLSLAFQELFSKPMDSSHLPLDDLEMLASMAKQQPKKPSQKRKEKETKAANATRSVESYLNSDKLMWDFSSVNNPQLNLQDLRELENRYGATLDFDSDHPLHAHFEEAEVVEDVDPLDIPQGGQDFMKDPETGIYDEQFSYLKPQLSKQGATDLEKVTLLYAEILKESSVSFSLMEQISRQRKQLDFMAAEENLEDMAKASSELQEVENAATFEKLKNFALRKEQEQLRSSSRSLYSIDISWPPPSSTPMTQTIQSKLIQISDKLKKIKTEKMALQQQKQDDLERATNFKEVKKVQAQILKLKAQGDEYNRDVAELTNELKHAKEASKASHSEDCFLENMMADITHKIREEKSSVDAESQNRYKSIIQLESLEEECKMLLRDKELELRKKRELSLVL